MSDKRIFTIEIDESREDDADEAAEVLREALESFADRAELRVGPFNFNVRVQPQ